jgi:hypothetical protein
MPESSALRTVLAKQLEATVARRTHDEILRNVPPAARGVQPEGLPDAYSPWQILEHMRVSQADYLHYCVDPDYDAPAWPDDYWPATVAPPRVEDWDESLAQFRSDLQDLKELVHDPSVDLSGTIPHVDEIQAREVDASYHGSTYAEEIAAIADHNAYHLGQFVTVRRLLGVWPPEGLTAPAWAGASQGRGGTT